VLQVDGFQSLILDVQVFQSTMAESGLQSSRRGSASRGYGYAHPSVSCFYGNSMENQDKLRGERSRIPATKHCQ
jgi:hypothetical protein